MTAYRLPLGGEPFPRKLHTESGGVYQVEEQCVDEDFLEVFKIALIAGRNFGGDDKWGVLLNESAVRLLGWENPVGKQLFTMDSAIYTVIIS